MNNRGVTLIEVISVATMVTVVGSISLISLKRNQIKSRKIEGKTELGMLYQAQSAYLFKNRIAFHDGIEGLVFPRGKKRFNVGYKNHPGKPKHNYVDLYDPSTSDFEFIKDTSTTHLGQNTHFAITTASAPGVVCADSTPPPPHDPRLKFKAYAIGHIQDGAVNSGNDLNKWTIDQDGTLEQTQDPL